MMKRIMWYVMTYILSSQVIRRVKCESHGTHQENQTDKVIIDVSRSVYCDGHEYDWVRLVDLTTRNE